MKARPLSLFLLSVALLGCNDTITEVVENPVPPSGSLVFVTDTSQLAWVDVDDPEHVLAGVALSGLGDQVLRTLDYRPATGELYGFSEYYLYRIDPQTGIALQVGNYLTGVPAPQIDIDVSPVADRVRLVSSDEDNMRLNPLTGQPESDTDLSAGDVAGIAYTNNRSGATSTTLFGIDITHDQLVRIGGVDGTPSPNGGVVTAIGPLGVDAGPSIAFDIAPDGTAYAALNVNAVTRLYRIDLTNGTALELGILGAGGGIRSMAVAP